MKMADPERNSDFVRRFFYGMSWASVVFALLYVVNDEAARSLACGFASLCFFVLSHLEYRDLDR